MKSSSGESGSGDSPRREQAERRSESALESRPEAWRLILADGSRTAAAGRSADASAQNCASHSQSGHPALRSASREAHGREEAETLSEFLQDEDLTLLDLDLLSDDLSLLSAEMVPADDEALQAAPQELTDEPAALSARDLALVIDAWPHLSADLRHAILWIAKGGLQANRSGY